MNDAPVAGLILAGGQARRLGQAAKAGLSLNDDTLAGHVIRRLSPQVGPLALAAGPGGQAQDAAATAGRAQERISACLADLEPHHRGPLAGLQAGLHWLQQDTGCEWLLLVPCDAPFLPPDLASRLLEAARRDGVRLSMAEDDGHPQPTFSLWHTDLAPAVDEALADPGGLGLMGVADAQPHVRVTWPPASPPPFFNVNTPEDLAQARQWLDPGHPQA
ncbi:molybdenum cofactor guanylyltransferase [Marinihelvus fidelis]|uniref:Molybdenum cofactor guanylyltransferase n=1 Tax=Marinihelvus fidelis TaxID=2613842 RepID=A0A5N0TEJ9_9GAMM|nr:molybdenum cofactor guanylyltransferase [Marinihelvus fidelis]KAA9132517.1 molybdenum cofactor guanylyltransferase [Marinihelvus fidelis]